jgi:hypothetical protein
VWRRDVKLTKSFPRQTVLYDQETPDVDSHGDGITAVHGDSVHSLVFSSQLHRLSAKWCNIFILA